MKKYLFILATAAIVASCSDTDTFKQINTAEDGENGAAIGFTSFTDKVTKAAAENSDALYTWTFFDHQENFRVWARKAGQATNEIFNGTIVTVTESSNVYTYTYSPARFWDKNATKYHFYAAAPAEPADGAWTFVDNNISADASLNAGYFTTATLLNGVNLKSVTNGGPDANLDNIFKEATLADGSTKDIDKLIAAPCEVLNTYYNKANPDAVNLNFIHILSKLNITIATKLYDANHAYDVDLLAFEVHNIPNAGDFSEATAIPNDKKIIRWTRTGTTTTNILTGIDNSTNKVDVANPSAVNTTGAKTYIVESLIMPQNIEYERVALDGQAHDAVIQNATHFATWEEYTQAHPIEGITKAEFDEIIAAGANATDVQLAKIEKTPAINIAAYAVPTKPYFTITYSIDGDIFTQNFNLAAAFLNYNNNNQKNTANGLANLVTSGNDADPTTFAFNEGWQNTLNIIINPDKIEFCADIATWSTEQNYNYEIEHGNE